MDEIRDDDVTRALAAFGASIPYRSFSEPSLPFAMAEADRGEGLRVPIGAAFPEAEPVIVASVELASPMMADQGLAAATDISNVAPQVAPALLAQRGHRAAVSLPARPELFLPRREARVSESAPRRTPMSEVFHALKADSPSDSLQRQLCRL
jgi:hypothetical protein